MKGLNSWRSFSFLIALSVTTLLSYLFLDFAAQNKYFGLDHNPQRPAYAGDLDPKCARHSESGPPCEYPKANAEKTVLLIGDSHAGDLSQAVIDAAHGNNWNAVVWSHGGSILQFSKSRYRQKDIHLVNANKIIEYLMWEQPDAVILSQSVHFYDDVELIKEGLRKAKNYVPNLLMISSRPIFFDDPFASRSLLGQRIRPVTYDKTVVKSKMVTKHKDIQRSVEVYASDIGIKIFDSSTIFCMDPNCFRYKNEQWLYTDSNHLSVAGAKLLVPYISSYLSSVD